MADIEIEIDGKQLTVPAGKTIIEAADAAGIYIPRFCYHKKLSVAANCRMCLVEVEKSPKALPACATPVMSGMRVSTRSPKTIEAQRAVMEFLLINHPLDCPICDQGGECELQDLAMGYGAPKSHYDECKRSVADENIGPLVATEMTRCILCTRCVRFGTEIAGLRELGTINRGGHNEIRTFVEETVKSEVSGNIIDLCPVGALTSKPYRFTARPWELQQAPSISPHDCLGSHLNVHTRFGIVKRVVPRENNAINEMWLSDRDRFSYEGLYHPERLQEPKAKINGRWETVDWEKALALAAKSIKEIIEHAGAEQLGALASPSSTTEELFLLQKITRALGSDNVDHRLREIDTSDSQQLAPFPGLGMSIADIENCDAIVLIGSNLQKEQPLAALRVRQAVKKGAKVFAVNPVDYDFNFAVTDKVICAPHNMPQAVKAAAQQFTVQLQDKKRVLVLVGAFAMHHAEAATIRAAAVQLMPGATVGYLTDGANGAGAWLAGAIPQQNGLSAYEMLNQPREAYLLLNVEPDLDCANAQQAIAAMQHAKLIVAVSTYRNPVLEQYAHVILPMSPFTETAGTYVNTVGEWQSFEGVAKPHGSARPAWKILRALANFMELEGFEYESSHQVRDAIPRGASAPVFAKNATTRQAGSSAFALSRIGEIPCYAIDGLSRRSEPLQMAQTLMMGDVDFVRLHPETAAKYKLNDGDIACVKQGSAEVKLPVTLDATIARDAIWIAGGIAATAELGDLMGEVTIC